jgi:hypothetical protein
MISFDMSNDQLQTIIIALGASPYIDARIIKDMQQVCTVLCYMMWVFSGISDGLLYRE